MARALGILHAPVEVAALGYDWVAGSLQADVALEELYGLNLFLAGLARPCHCVSLTERQIVHRQSRDVPRHRSGGGMWGDNVHLS